VAFYFSANTIYGYSGQVPKPNEMMKLVITTFVGIVFGFFLGVSFPALSLTKVCGYFTGRTQTTSLNLWLVFQSLMNFHVAWLIVVDESSIFSFSIN